MVIRYDYSAALRKMKRGERMRRIAWKSDKWIVVRQPAEHAAPEQLSYLEIHTAKGVAPWTPTRCDQFVDDWIAIEPESHEID